LKQAIKTLIEALFRVLFTYDCIGEEKVPASGPAIIAANHPSYIDAFLLGLQVRRPIHFMAWDAWFKVPLVGAFMRVFDAFPVDTQKGKGREAYEKAKNLLRSGEVVGIFPEGKRSRTGWLEPALREGAARLAWETGAPLIPATITGAYRAWPHYQSLPRPARIRVRYHEPIDPGPWRAMGEDEALPALLAELRRRVERSLLPGVKADLRMNVLYRLPSPWPRNYESAPVLALALLVFWRTRSLLAVAPAWAYVGYLLLDHFVIPQSKLAKWIRNSSPILFLFGYGPHALRYLGLPEVPAGAALAALMMGALFPYLYEHGRTAIAFIRGFVIAACLELAALYVAPTGVGPHVALPLFAAAFAWERKTVFWRYAAPVLAAYAVGSPFLFRVRPMPLAPHAMAGLLGWLLVRLWPYRLRERVAEEPAAIGLGLRL
jgi:1-acyl-sn-glycerol-3-phosphate acyltransferase